MSPNPAPKIERAIKDEIHAMSSHFTMAVSDLEFATQAEMKKIRGTFSFVHDRPVMASILAGVPFVVGLVIGHLVG